MPHITQTETEVQLHFSIPKANSLPERIVAAFIGIYGAAPRMPDGTKMSDAEYTWQKIRWLVAEVLRKFEADQAALNAARDAMAAVDIEINTLD